MCGGRRVAPAAGNRRGHCALRSRAAAQPLRFRRGREVRLPGACDWGGPALARATSGTRGREQAAMKARARSRPASAAGLRVERAHADSWPMDGAHVSKQQPAAAVRHSLSDCRCNAAELVLFDLIRTYSYSNRPSSLGGYCCCCCRCRQCRCRQAKNPLSLSFLPLLVGRLVVLVVSYHTV